MGTKAFKKIEAGLVEALEIARGRAKPARLYVPAELDVKAIRAKAKLSQSDFAAYFGFTATQIKDWEQGRSRPLGGNRAYLMIIEQNPEKVLEILRAITTSRKSKRAA
jgi:putative transcriptional regulator